AEADAPDSQAAGADTSSEAPGTPDIEINLYPSDLLKLGFTLDDAAEWIERLTFVGVLDDSGMVRDPTLFSDPENRDSIRISAGLGAYPAEFPGWLAGQRNRWLDAALTWPDDIWDDRPLPPAQADSLEQNLAFNHHIDSRRAIADRKALQALKPDT